ncbi:unnamed protein product [Sphagnum jensenii]|uniref:DNA-directed RNA polymerase n=1 Tax=Sphagnum jensenii TaxID=128206 RepID=A0ABP1B9I2_9BRYO
MLVQNPKLERSLHPVVTLEFLLERGKEKMIVASEKIQNSQESSGLDYVNASLINEDFADKNISSKGKYLCSTIDKEGLPHNHV